MLYDITTQNTATKEINTHTIEATTEEEAIKEVKKHISKKTNTPETFLTVLKIQDFQEAEKLDTWTITARFTVFAGDMDKDQVIQNAEQLLESITDGSDFAGYTVIDAKRDTL